MGLLTYMCVYVYIYIYIYMGIVSLRVLLCLGFRVWGLGFRV